MADLPDQAKNISSKEFTDTAIVEGAFGEPDVGLFQPVYRLTEVEFVRLRQSSPALNAAAGSIISFGLAYGLPLFTKYFTTDPKVRQPLSQADLWVAGMTTVVGILLLILGHIFSSDRRAVLKRIKAYFAANPGTHEVRPRR